MISETPARIFAFSEVSVYVTPEDSKIVEWRLDRQFKFSNWPLQFFIEWAWPAGDWTRLNPEDPLTNTCFYVDNHKYRCSASDDIYYRVVAYDGVQEYASRPAHTLGQLNRHTWLLARDILRKEYLRLQKFIGTFGYLLRRREHGERCPVCTEFDIEDPVTSQCPVCYGTGIVYGYYNAYPYWIDLSGTIDRKDVEEPFGVVDNQVRQGRGVAYPRIHAWDLWVHGSANVRFIVRSCTIGADLQGVPLIYTPIELRAIPPTGIEYSIPMERGPDSSSSSGSSTIAEVVQGWRRGIAFEEVW